MRVMVRMAYVHQDVVHGLSPIILHLDQSAHGSSSWTSVALPPTHVPVGVILLVIASFVEFKLVSMGGQNPLQLTFPYNNQMM